MNSDSALAGCTLVSSGDNEITITLSGRLTQESVSTLWQKVSSALQEGQPTHLIVEAAQLAYCDTIGVSLLVYLLRYQKDARRGCEIRGLSESIEKLLEVFLRGGIEHAEATVRERNNWIECLGQKGDVFFKDIYRQIAFSGELISKLCKALLHPRLFRWRDIWHLVEVGGVQALPIVLSLSFLMGLIMAFQAAIPMRQFGADVFVADLVALSMLRELGPLMTAVILAGRTGSSFAAELGTMRVNEELDALHTMGLNPISFLITNRVFAVLIFTPVLTVLADCAGLIGGGVVFRSLGYPIVTYYNQIVAAVGLNDFVGGFVKSFVFAILIASIGCLRGLETKTGASAVGMSATRAVVSGLTLIVVVDGIFSVIYYCLGI